MSKTRTTVYVDSELLSNFELFKQSNKEDKINFSGLVEDLLRKHLSNPFNWENETLYNFTQNKENR